MASSPPGPADPAAREFVTHGRIDVEGRLVDASNVTLFCAIELAGVTGRVVYKPVSGSGRCGTSRTARWPAARSPPR